MRKIILASNNQHKIKEFKEIFSDAEILSLNDIGFDNDIVEDGETFLDNALIKCRVVREFLKEEGLDANIIADDSGLCVNALNGEPGIYSARYAGGHGDNVANRAKLLEELKGKSDRSAYFNCTIVEMFPNGEYIYSEGKTYGTILEEEIGDKSFGYDCLFMSDDLHKSFGEATSDEKNKVSHRGRAITDLIGKEKMVDKFEKLDRKIRDKKVGKQDEVFEAIGNDKIEKFFENYKKFDKFLVTKDKNALIYSGHIFLDAEVSGKLHSDFREAFENSIKGIVGENIFERMRIFLEEKDYLLSTESKRFDGDPFLDDDFQVITLGDKTIAQFIEKRNTFNNVEFHYIIYPNRIFSFVNKLCKDHNLKI